jgi:protein-S-isoprenylcysteine O-methyltransferase Ste14
VVFAAACTAYVLVGVRIEERDLEAALGERYRDYQRRVPRLLPRPGVHYDPASETPDASAGVPSG